MNRGLNDHPTILNALNRIGARRPLKRVGLVGEPTVALSSDTAEVVQLLAEGKSTKEVAVDLDLSVKTAETHRSNIMRKLGLHSISELVLYAVRNNIVQVATGAVASPAPLPAVDVPTVS